MRSRLSNVLRLSRSAASATGSARRAARLPAHLKSILDQPLPVHIPEDPYSPIPAEFINRPGLRIAAIADEMSWRCWQYEAELIPFQPEDWHEVLSRERFDLLLVESTWSGVGGEWGKHLYGLSRRSRRSSILIDQIVDFCREKRDIPTVFYSKEDPVDRRGFLGAAERFDFIFTTDEDSIPYYESKLGHRRIACLPFAAQPRIHNPDSASGKREGNVFFAGSWYAKRHRDRRRQAESILRPALDYGLEIFDRVEHLVDPHYAWPPKYQTANVGTLPYARMLEANKHYRVGLNLNSVTRSTTMLSRRVFELLACGTPVVSSPSAAISGFFGDDLVLISENVSETRAHLDKLFAEDAYWQRLAGRGVEAVYADHTYDQRLNQLLAVVGIRNSPELEDSGRNRDVDSTQELPVP